MNRPITYEEVLDKAEVLQRNELKILYPKWEKYYGSSVDEICIDLSLAEQCMFKTLIETMNERLQWLEKAQNQSKK